MLLVGDPSARRMPEHLALFQQLCQGLELGQSADAVEADELDDKITITGIPWSNQSRRAIKNAKQQPTVVSIAAIRDFGEIEERYAAHKEGIRRTVTDRSEAPVAVAGCWRIVIQGVAKQRV